jgi:hypothetical protein
MIVRHSDGARHSGPLPPGVIHSSRGFSGCQPPTCEIITLFSLLQLQASTRAAVSVATSLPRAEPLLCDFWVRLQEWLSRSLCCGLWRVPCMQHSSFWSLGPLQAQGEVQKGYLACCKTYILADHRTEQEGKGFTTFITLTFYCLLNNLPKFHFPL